jgi:signal transduction histidine kinase
MPAKRQSYPVNVPLQRLPVAAAAFDAGGVIAAVNHRFHRLLRCARSTRSKLTLAELVSEVDRPAVDELIRELVALGKKTPAVRRIIVMRSQRPALQLSLTCSPLAPGSPAPYLLCAEAIPRRRRRDRETLQSPQRAERALRSAEGSPSFVTTLSHELRGPLTAIRGWAAMAEMGAIPADRYPAALKVIGRNAETLTRLIETLFDFSRQATGSLMLNRQLLDLNELVRRVTESLLPIAQQHDVNLIARCSRSALLVNGDPLRLEQVVRNLVDNAIKFTPPGGEVDLETVCKGLHAELLVDDSGVGIPRDLLRKIFEPFRHGSTAVRQSDTGLGLGLALVRELVQLHEGEVRALSAGRGQGSTFIVKLPLAPLATA